MFQYIIRRLLLMIPTFFGTTILVFFILQSTPSGPFEKALLEIKMAKMNSGEGQQQTTSDDSDSGELSPKFAVFYFITFRFFLLFLDVVLYSVYKILSIMLDLPEKFFPKIPTIPPSSEKSTLLDSP